MENSVRRFCDALAAPYHLNFADWDAPIARQAQVLDRLIGEALGPRPKRVFDCVAGIGTARGRSARFRTTYRALRRNVLTRTLAETGFTDVMWHDPATSGFYQPLVTAGWPQAGQGARSPG